MLNKFNALPLVVRRLLLAGMIIPIVASLVIRGKNGLLLPGFLIFDMLGYWIVVFAGIWVYGRFGK